MSQRQILYVKNPYSILESYGLPNWIGAWHYIESDYEFGKQIENAAKNGFAPKTMVTMIGRNMSKEERLKSSNDVQERMNGSEGEQTIVAFVAKKEEAPSVEAIQIPNLDKMVSVYSNLNDAKILTSHNVTSPSLFGVMTAGTMGGTGTEMISAYNIFRATETLPDRRKVVESFEVLFEATQMKGIDIEVVEEDVNVDYKTKPTEDGNTTKPQGEKEGEANK